MQQIRPDYLLDSPLALPLLEHSARKYTLTRELAENFNERKRQSPALQQEENRVASGREEAARTAVQRSSDVVSQEQREVSRFSAKF